MTKYYWHTIVMCQRSPCGPWGLGDAGRPNPSWKWQKWANTRSLDVRENCRNVRPLHLVFADGQNGDQLANSRTGPHRSRYYQRQTQLLRRVTKHYTVSFVLPKDSCENTRARTFENGGKKSHVELIETIQKYPHGLLKSFASV